MLASPIVQIFIRSALGPAVGVALMFLISGGLKESLRARVQSFILFSGFALGSSAIVNRWGIPPGEAGETFTWGLLALTLTVLLFPKGIGIRYWIRALNVFLLGLALLWPLRQTILSPENYRNLIAFFCLGLGVWSIVERNVNRLRPTSMALLSVLITMSISFLSLFSGSASFSQLATIASAIAGALFMVLWFFPKRVAVPALVPFFSVFSVMLMAGGHFYLGINPWHLIYLCIPFGIIWIRTWLVFIPKRPVIEELGLGLLAAGPVFYFLYNAFKAAGPLY